MGFGAPIAKWLRGPLREWAEDLLTPEALKSHGFFEIEIVRRRWQEHLSGVRNWQYHLWDVLVFQDWFFHQVRDRQLV
jgi:asparagine synthase (glutamine-hydrolysing)